MVLKFIYRVGDGSGNRVSWSCLLVKLANDLSARFVATADAQKVINEFKSSDCRWVVAVGMISEGTDIPQSYSNRTALPTGVGTSSSAHG